MTSDEMPDWARDMSNLTQILLERVNTLEFQAEERRSAEILDPSPRVIAEKAVRIAKSANDIGDATSNLTYTLVRSLREEQSRAAKSRDRIAELEQRLAKVEARLNKLDPPPANKPGLRW